MKSLGQMVKQLNGLRGTKDVTEWEEDFIRSVFVWTDNGEKTAGLSSKQIQVIERLYRKHFA